MLNVNTYEQSNHFQTLETVEHFQLYSWLRSVHWLVSYRPKYVVPDSISKSDCSIEHRHGDNTSIVQYST